MCYNVHCVAEKVKRNFRFHVRLQIVLFPLESKPLERKKESY